MWTCCARQLSLRAQGELSTVLHELLTDADTLGLSDATCIQLQTSLTKSSGRVAFGYRRATSTYCRSGWLSVYAGTCGI